MTKERIADLRERVRMVDPAELDPEVTQDALLECLDEIERLRGLAGAVVAAEQRVNEENEKVLALELPELYTQLDDVVAALAEAIKE